MTVYDKYGDDWKSVVLKDDDTPYGGTAFSNETLYDFVGDEFDPCTAKIELLNEQLKACGIQAI